MVEIIKKLAIKYHIMLSDEEKQMEQEWKVDLDKKMKEVKRKTKTK
jgi:dihydroneopterin aldolase